MTISEEKQAYLQREREESFAGKTKTKLQLSLRTHRGQLTKLLGVMEGCTESLEAIPSARCADELEDLKDKSFAKMEDIEYGYNVLMELDPEAEKEYRDLIKNCVDKYVAQTRRAQKALGKATPAAPKPTASKNTDTVKIREGLKPKKTQTRVHATRIQGVGGRNQNLLHSLKSQVRRDNGTEGLPKDVHKLGARI